MSCADAPEGRAPKRAPKSLLGQYPATTRALLAHYSVTRRNRPLIRWQSHLAYETAIPVNGLTSFKEFIAGTNPTNAASVLRIESFGPSGGGFALSFTAVSNRAYVVEVLPALADGVWTNLVPVSAAPTNRILWLTNTPATDASRFYRLAIP
jgi:hypothetical protein